MKAKLNRNHLGEAASQVCVTASSRSITRRPMIVVLPAFKPCGDYGKIVKSKYEVSYRESKQSWKLPGSSPLLSRLMCSANESREFAQHCEMLALHERSSVTVSVTAVRPVYTSKFFTVSSVVPAYILNKTSIGRLSIHPSFPDCPTILRPTSV